MGSSSEERRIDACSREWSAAFKASEKRLRFLFPSKAHPRLEQSHYPKALPSDGIVGLLCDLIVIMFEPQVFLPISSALQTLSVLPSSWAQSVAMGIQWAEAKDAAKIPSMHQEALVTKNSLALTCSSEESLVSLL